MAARRSLFPIKLITRWRRMSYKKLAKFRRHAKLSSRRWVLRITAPENDRVSKEKKTPAGCKPEHAPSTQPAGDLSLILTLSRSLSPSQYSPRPPASICPAPSKCTRPRRGRRHPHRHAAVVQWASALTSGRAFFTAIAKSAFAHRRQINHVVTHESSLGGGDSVFLQNLAQTLPALS